MILAVARDNLFQGDQFEGFKDSSEIDFESRILENCKFMKRGPLEDDPRYKQPIGYALIVNPELKKVFAYQRAVEDEKYTETRLQGKWSWGIGGHIEKSEGGEENPIYASLRRELEEEVEMNGTIKNIKVLGYINLEHDVHAVHFGILYIVETDAKNIKPKDPEVEVGELKDINELEEICESDEFSVEGWSEIALIPLKRYFEK